MRRVLLLLCFWWINIPAFGAPSPRPVTIIGRILAFSSDPVCLNGNGYWSLNYTGRETQKSQLAIPACGGFGSLRQVARMGVKELIEKDFPTCAHPGFRPSSNGMPGRRMRAASIAAGLGTTSRRGVRRASFWKSATCLSFAGFAACPCSLSSENSVCLRK